jgi:hypothetical protein
VLGTDGQQSRTAQTQWPRLSHGMDSWKAYSAPLPLVRSEPLSPVDTLFLFVQIKDIA